MKCFSLLFLILLSTAQAADFVLKATSSEKVSIGDIIQLKAETENTEDLEKLESYKNRRISELLYVLEVKKEKEEYFLDCIISEKEKKEKVEVEDNFKIRDIVFEYKKVDLKNAKFDFLLDPTTIFKNKFIKIGMGLLLGIILFYALLMIRQVFKVRKDLSSKRSKIKTIVNQEFSRDIAERVYQLRNKVSRYFGDVESLNHLSSKLQAIQYKESWSEEEELEIRGLFEVFKKDILK